MVGSKKVEPARSRVVGPERPTGNTKAMVNIRANRNTHSDTLPPTKKTTGSRVTFQNPEYTEEKKDEYHPSNKPALREQWFEKCSDLLGSIPLVLPPIREINHRIPLTDPDLRYSHHTPRCPEALQEELQAKITRYTTAGWWEMKAVYQAALLLCVPKKNSKLRTVVDVRKRNNNTHKDITPFPDKDQIQMDIAPTKY